MDINKLMKMLPTFLYNFFKKIYLHGVFLKNYLKFRRLSKNSIDSARFQLTWLNRFPCLYDNTSVTSFEAHYIYHPAWAARILSKINPIKHIDVGSILQFSSLVSAFIPIDFYDYRPANIKLSGLAAKQGDLLQLPLSDNSVQSLSCMHTVEHVGLGRYGDPLDPEGDLKAIKELQRVLAVGGNLLFVVPIGRSRLQFNAHRIYSYEQIITYFSDLKLIEFSLIPDNALEVGMISPATQKQADAQTYGCGCFLFTKE